MTSLISPLSPVPIEDLRQRVREAESLLGVARRLARDELHDPASCERARDRIVSILREIDGLFPNLNEPPAPLDPAELVAPSMRGAPEALAAAAAYTAAAKEGAPGEIEKAGGDVGGHAEEETAEAEAPGESGDDDRLEDVEAGDEGAGEGGDGAEADGEGEGEGEEHGWELDRGKLAAAIENEDLMSKIPEMDREWFRKMARRVIEAHERVELCDRVRKAFDELAGVMREGLDATAKQLAVALTFEQLQAKLRQ